METKRKRTSWRQVSEREAKKGGRQISVVKKQQMPFLGSVYFRH